MSNEPKITREMVALFAQGLLEHADECLAIEVQLGQSSSEVAEWYRQETQSPSPQTLKILRSWREERLAGRIAAPEASATDDLSRPSPWRQLAEVVQASYAGSPAAVEPALDDRHVEAFDGFRLSQQPSVTVRDTRVKEEVRPRNRYFLGIVAIATMTMATALLLMLSGTTMPTTPPSAVAVDMQPADGVQRASENAVDPDTEYVVGPKTPSSSYWAVFLCDDRGLKLLREGKPGEKLDPRWQPFCTPSRDSSQFAYTISIATHWKCSNLLTCLQAGLTAEDLKRLQQREFARSDEDCKETTAFFSKIANTCTCTKGLSTVLAERWIIADPVPKLPSTKE